MPKPHLWCGFNQFTTEPDLEPIWIGVSLFSAKPIKLLNICGWFSGWDSSSEVNTHNHVHTKAAIIFNLRRYVIVRFLKSYVCVSMMGLEDPLGLHQDHESSPPACGLHLFSVNHWASLINLIFWTAVESKNMSPIHFHVLISDLYGWVKINIVHVWNLKLQSNSFIFFTCSLSSCNG